MDKKTQTSPQTSHPAAAETLIADYQRVVEELQEVRQDQKQGQIDLEAAIERANALAAKAEIANIELNQIINTSVDGMFLVYQDFTVKRINDSLLSFLNLKEADALGRKCSELMASPWCGTPECPLTKILHKLPRIEMDIRRQKQDGTTIPFMFTATPFRGIDGELIGMVARLKDITERKYAEDMLREANQRLEHLATIDGLTQVANRRFFDQTLEREWNRLKRTGEPLSLILCDVDFFKFYNDTYGHQAGDDCLRAVAKAMDNSAKRSGDCVARYGGEEFVAILPATDAKGADRVAENIRLSIEQLGIEHKSSKVAPCVTLSLGVTTMIPSDAGSPLKLVHCADKALYEAKSSGRNRSIQWSDTQG